MSGIPPEDNEPFSTKFISLTVPSMNAAIVFPSFIGDQLASEYKEIKSKFYQSYAKPAKPPEINESVMISIIPGKSISSICENIMY